MQTADKRVPIAACDDLSDFEGVLRDVGDMLSELETRKIYLSFLKKYGMAMYEVDNKVSFETLQEIFWGN
jgi:uncharacterized protein (DUF934 family)